MGFVTKIDIRVMMQTVINLINRKPAPCTSPCDGFILKLHYQYTFWMFMAGFACITYSWHTREVISCASHFNAETQIKMNHVNVCLTYPFVQKGAVRQYLLFYRWIHWTNLLLAFAFYLVRKVSKHVESKKYKKLFEDTAYNLERYDSIQTEKALVEKASKVFIFNKNTHCHLYYKYLGTILLSLIINLVVFQFLDYILLNKFVDLGYQALPFNRDFNNYTDPLSRAFPPFVDCVISPQHQIINMRTETFGCHLTAMEFYEKYYIFVWAWLIVITFLTAAYLLFMVCFNIPRFRYFFLGASVSKSSSIRSSEKTVIKRALEKCKVGDFFLIYKFKSVFDAVQYYEFLELIGDRDFQSLAISEMGNEIFSKQPPNQQQHPNVRQRGRPDNNMNGVIPK